LARDIFYDRMSGAVVRQEGEEGGYSQINPDAPGYKKLKMNPDAKGNDSERNMCPQSSVLDEAYPADKFRQRVNRFGNESEKLKSKARNLGFHPGDYVPKAGAALESRNLLDTMASSMSSASNSELIGSDEWLKEEVDILKESGLDLEEITRFVYDHLHEETLPNFGKFLLLDEDGGLDRVHLLWYKERIFWAIVLFGSVSMNVFYILNSNWLVFQGFSSHFIASNPQSIGDIEETIQDMGQGSDDNDIFGRIQDKHRKGLILQMAGVVGTVEVIWMVLQLLRALYQCGVYFFSSDEYTQYRTGFNFFNQLLPALSTFSVLKSVKFVHPALLASSYYEMLQQRSCGCFRRCCPPQVADGLQTGMMTLFFIITRVLVGAMAVAAFAMKLTAVGLKLIDPKYKFLGCFFSTALLMNQCMGAVMIERLLQDRIFLFIFGGSDTDFRPDELALKGVYQCRLAKQIWEHYYVQAPRFSGWKAIVVMATLDHFDLQMLLINDEEDVSNNKTKNNVKANNK